MPKLNYQMIGQRFMRPFGIQVVLYPNNDLGAEGQVVDMMLSREVIDPTAVQRSYKTTFRYAQLQPELKQRMVVAVDDTPFGGYYQLGQCEYDSFGWQSAVGTRIYRPEIKYYIAYKTATTAFTADDIKASTSASFENPNATWPNFPNNSRLAIAYNTSLGDLTSVMSNQMNMISKFTKQDKDVNLGTNEEKNPYTIYATSTGLDASYATTPVSLGITYASS